MAPLETFLYNVKDLEKRSDKSPRTLWSDSFETFREKIVNKSLEFIGFHRYF